MTEPKKDINTQYLEKMNALTERAQATGEAPSVFSYAYNGKSWVLSLPRSVMAQKQLIHIRNTYLETGTYDAEKAMLDVMAANAICDGKPVKLDMLELGEIEVMKLAYMDGLLLPLSLGGEKALLSYMEAVVANL